MKIFPKSLNFAKLCLSVSNGYVVGVTLFKVLASIDHLITKYFKSIFYLSFCPQPLKMLSFYVELAIKI